MKRWQWYTVAVFAGLVALEALVFAAPTPNNCGVNMLCRVRTLIVSGDATFSGDAGWAGNASLGGNLAVGGTLAVVGKSTFAGVNAGDVVLDGGARLVLNGATTHLESDGFGGVTGGWGAGANFTGNYSTSADVNVDGYGNFKTGVRNTGTGAACSSNTSAVCVNDAAGLAVADGSGATVATISAAGAAVFNGGSTIGTGGAAITASFAGSGTLDFASALVNACSADLTITVTGATTSSTVSLQVPNGSVAAGSIFFPWVSATDTVSVRHCCAAGASCDPASGTFLARVFVP